MLKQIQSTTLCKCLNVNSSYKRFAVISHYALLNIRSYVFFSSTDVHLAKHQDGVPRPFETNHERWVMLTVIVHRITRGNFQIIKL